jgi:hypothetical protein
MKLKLEVDIEIVEEFEDKDIIGRVYYPDEGNKIQIKKGLNTIESSEVIRHELGHLLDWYVSNGQQSENVDIREQNADIIGDSFSDNEANFEQQSRLLIHYIYSIEQDYIGKSLPEYIELYTDSKNYKQIIKEDNKISLLNLIRTDYNIKDISYWNGVFHWLINLKLGLSLDIIKEQILKHYSYAP